MSTDETTPPASPEEKEAEAQENDPKRDRDKPQYPAPGGVSEGGSDRNPEGAGGPPPSGLGEPVPA